MLHVSIPAAGRRLAAPLLCVALTAAGCATDGDKVVESPRGRPLLRTTEVVIAGPTITTKSAQAQTHFEAGLRSYFEGNRDGAAGFFRTATDVDPGCGMCFWGLALATAPTPGAPEDAARTSEANAALQRAMGLTAVLRAPERGYIDAMSQRLTPAGGPDAASRYRSYVRAMQALASQYPGDHDAAVLAAEASLSLPAASPEPPPAAVTASKGVSSGPTDTGDAAAALRNVLSENPSHPGAKRLYASSVQRNLVSRWHAAMMAGQEAQAMAASREIDKALSPDVMRENPDLEGAAAVRYFTLVRFGRWDQILAEPAPPNDLDFLVGSWYYARGLAFTRKVQFLEVPPEQAELDEAASRIPPDQTVLGIQNARKVLRLASLVLEAELEHIRAHRENALVVAREAVKLEDSLGSGKSSAWYVPTRQVYGALLLWNDRPREAEQAFREDLERNPDNGWSLLGLSQSLQAQKRVQEAADAKARAQAAFQASDVKPPTSVF